MLLKLKCMYTGYFFGKSLCPLPYILVLIIITCYFKPKFSISKVGRQYYRVIMHLVIVPLSLHLVSKYLSLHWFSFPKIVLNYIYILKKVKFGKDLNKS